MPQKKLIKNLYETGIIDAIGDPISIQDTDFIILYQNQRYIDLVGDHAGKKCYKAYHGKDRICSGCPLTRSFRDGRPHTVEHTRSAENGITYSLSTASVLRDSGGNIIAGIEIVRDITERKLLEKQLMNEKNKLEMHVNERTASLKISNEKLLAEISERKKIEENLLFTEKELMVHLKELKEVNTALKVLLNQRDDDKKEFEKNIILNMKNLILPYIEKLKKNRAMSDNLVYLNIIESNLKEIVAPFSSRLSSNYQGLTPKEIQIADLIKDGKQDKEIGDILNISLDTAKTHRKNIRKKLGIYGLRINLRSHLISRF